ncbi:SEC-C domain-containing protein [Budviciaceae bacterium CWB-B4]|uniref:SEC-C domain-containing protein n=1 Tax=Limnobaculum xujianqingii TaxID=2738837 RepID=A0A9D7AJY7_9GAMM|nr:YchJ family metal-binding protein [Limnobaculum xujianqingii]MBK5073754.1 SEC-C domain-containing protein [Limnobaculum xujianqingii]MBK5177352.1 SEC-C domain-containing protein [Limnobaculum xujianqingii]
MFKLCPCGSLKEFSICCHPLISGQTIASTALELMKSRYSAYVSHDVEYLVATWHPDFRSPDLAESITHSFEHTQWLGLNIVATAEHGNESYVEFVAKYLDTQSQQQHSLHERSHFIKLHGSWYYTSGIKPQVGRNDLCPCGSMKKYKKCCGK